MTDLGKIKRIDTHCHLWRQELSRQSWLVPELGPLYRTFDTADLEQIARRANISGFVLIESGKTAEENRLLEQFADTSSKILAFIAYADLCNSNLGHELDAWQKNAKFRGIRMGFEGSADPGVIKTPVVIEGLKEVARRDLIFEFLVQPGQLPDIARIYDKVPQLKGIIEHMGKPDVLQRTDIDQWRQQMRLLGQIDNLYCKLSFSPRVQDIDWFLKNPRQGSLEAEELVRSSSEFLLEQFDTKRLMWASDWPICLLIQEYGQMRETFAGILEKTSASVATSIFSDNARCFYQIEPED